MSEPNDLDFRRADAADLGFLVELRDGAARWMAERGITGQWQPGELGEDHFRRVLGHGEIWIARDGSRAVGAWELWWSDEAAWGARPPVAGYVHRLMVDRRTARPGTGSALLRAAEERVARAGRELVRLDCLADNERLNSYYLRAGYRAVGTMEGKPQPGGVRKSYTLMEKRVLPEGS
ncbi:GNAT family N-acetyltransferase [Streptomyces sp. NPDC001941]|uniref:GNAT family N-acetyltransferase n=1 Tax=Streptomyces sp. NPDC001941 TaxID=3154659 RepID=UPI003333DBB2